jgi:kynureninase
VNLTRSLNAYLDENKTLREKVTELEGRNETLRQMREHEIAELRRQINAAWMRGDLRTGDRIADLIGAKRPSEHEADVLKKEGAV